MVLAYFMRKDYEAEIDTLLRNQEAQAEIVKAQAESIQAMREIQTERRLEAEAIRDAEIARRQEAEAEREAANRLLLDQNDLIRQLLEQNRQMLEIIDRRRNGNDGHAPNAAPEPPNHPQE